MPITESKPGLIAGEAITKGYLIMPTSGSFPTVEATALDTSVPIGVATADAAIGEEVPYEPLDGNVRLLYASGAISEGDNICPDGANDGQVKTAAAGDQVCGIANIEATTGAGLFRATAFQGHLLA
jgi:hypothetical protein